MTFTFRDAPDQKLDSPLIQDIVMHALMTVALLPKAARDDSKGAIWNAIRDWGLATELAPPDILTIRRYAMRGTRDDLGKLWIGVRLKGQHYRLTARYVQLRRGADIAGVLRNAGFPVTRGIEHVVRAIKTSDWAARGGQRASAPGRPIGGAGSRARISASPEPDAYDLDVDSGDPQENDENAIANYGLQVDDGYGTVQQLG